MLFTFIFQQRLIVSTRKHGGQIIDKALRGIRHQFIGDIDPQIHKKLILRAAVLTAGKRLIRLLNGIAEQRGIRRAFQRLPLLAQIGHQGIRGQNTFLHRIIQVSNAIRDIIRRFHNITKRKTAELTEL